MAEICTYMLPLVLESFWHIQLQLDNNVHSYMKEKHGHDTDCCLIWHIRVSCLHKAIILLIFIWSQDSIPTLYLICKVKSMTVLWQSLILLSFKSLSSHSVFQVNRLLVLIFLYFFRAVWRYLSQAFVTVYSVQFFIL